MHALVSWPYVANVGVCTAERREKISKISVSILHKTFRRDFMPKIE